MYYVCVDAGMPVLCCTCGVDSLHLLWVLGIEHSSVVGLCSKTF